MIDTGLLMAGILSAQTYYDRDNAVENEIRRLADELYRAVDWKWAMNEGELMSLGWTPESGFQTVHLAGLQRSHDPSTSSQSARPRPTKKLDGSVWNRWTATYNYSSFQNYEMVNFSPLFGHQYSHMWIGFRRDQGRLMTLQTGSRLFENSRRATLANRSYCIEIRVNTSDTAPISGGLTACDGPGAGTYGKWAYHARGSAAGSPTTARSPRRQPADRSRLLRRTLRRAESDEKLQNGALYTDYGFLDSFNPSEDWIDGWWLGIDQGPILVMLENYRTQLIWKLMKRTPTS